jgi:tetratricopeptide (TPR) repeat protein
MTDPILGQHLRLLLDAQLIKSVSAETLEFQHALTREAVYATLLKRQRTAYHALAAEVLEGQPGDETQTAVLAFHHREAGNWPRALEFAQKAGQQAQEMNAPREAAEHFTRAIEAAGHLGLPPDARLLRARGQAYDTYGDFDRACADYELGLRVAAEAGATTEEWQALLDLGLLWAGRDYGRTGEYLRQALELARVSGRPLMVAARLNRLGNWDANTGRMAHGLKMHQEALKMFTEQGAPAGIAATHDLLCLTHLMNGNIIDSLSHGQQAIGLYRRLDDKRGLSTSLSAYSALVGYCDIMPWIPLAADRCRQDFAEALALAEQIGWLAGRAMMQWLLGLSLMAYGQLGEALASGSAALHTATEIEHRQWIAASHFIIGRAYLLLLAPETAARHLRTAQSLAYELGSTVWIGSTSAYLALALVQAGQPEASNGVLQAAATTLHLPADWPTHAPETLSERLLCWAWAEAALARGQPAEALAAANGLIESAVNPAGEPIAHLLRLKGAALMALGQLDAAQVAFDLALEGGRRHGTRPVLWQIRADRGRLASQRRRPDDARREFAAAHLVVEELAQAVEPGPLRDTFLSRALSQLKADDIMAAPDQPGA